jgi:uncharacterized protein
MYFNVSQLLIDSNGSRRSYNVDDVAILMDESPASGIVGDVDLLRTDKGIWVSATLDSTVQCVCSRCLKEYEQPIQLFIQEEFFRIEDAGVGGKDSGGIGTDETFYIDQSHTLDLREAARQYSALCLPMKPICHPECIGLCPGCGVNLNETRCLCDNTAADGRWGPLIEFASTRESDGYAR